MDGQPQLRIVLRLAELIYPSLPDSSIRKITPSRMIQPIVPPASYRVLDSRGILQ